MYTKVGLLWLYRYCLSRPPFLKICPHGDAVITISIKQACLPWLPPFLQHISTAVMQQLGYLVFYNRGTPIKLSLSVTNFIQLVSPQPEDWFSQTKLHWKASNDGYPHTCGMYKSDNKQARYQVISNCKIFIC